MSMIRYQNSPKAAIDLHVPFPPLYQTMQSFQPIFFNSSRFLGRFKKPPLQSLRIHIVVSELGGG